MLKKTYEEMMIVMLIAVSMILKIGSIATLYSLNRISHVIVIQ